MKIKTIKTANHRFLLVALALFIPLFDTGSALDFNLPYGYYQLLRFAVCGFSAYAAYLAYQQNKERWVWVLGITAFIFNPFYKFHFYAGTWKFFDFIASVIFVIAAFKFKKK